MGYGYDGQRPRLFVELCFCLYYETGTPKRFVDFLKNINIQSHLEPYPSLCLGAVEISLYEMLWGYSMFPSGGFSTKPYYIRIEDKNGNILDRFDTERRK